MTGPVPSSAVASPEESLSINKWLTNLCVRRPVLNPVTCQQKRTKCRTNVIWFIHSNSK